MIKLDFARRRPLHAAAVVAVVLGVAASFFGCGPGGSTQSAASASAATPPRFAFVRGQQFLVRIDTATGRVWTTPLTGAGGWSAVGAAPQSAGLAAEHGRYAINIWGGGAPARQGGARAVGLLRTDRATGRAWILPDENSTRWTLVEETDNPSASLPNSSIPPTAARDPARSPPAPVEPVRSVATPPQQTTDRGGIGNYPILSREKLGVTAAEKQESLNTLRSAISKPQLPTKMRVWAVRQLGQMEPAIAVPELVTVLRMGEPKLVVEAILQLEQIGDPRSIPKILVLSDHPSREVREAVQRVVVEVP